jgi:hypothetical protein
MAGPEGVHVSISGGCDISLFELDEAADRYGPRQIFHKSAETKLKVSVVLVGLLELAGLMEFCGGI